MYILEGAATLLAAIAVYLWAEGLHHRKTAPNWARGQLFASIVGLAMVALVPTAAGLLTYGLGQPMTQIGWLGIAALGLAPLMLWRGTCR